MSRGHFFSAMFTAVLALCWVSAGGVQTAHAQAGKKPAQEKEKKKEPRNFAGKGKIDSISAGEIKMTNDKGESFTLKLNKNSEIRVHGTAQRDYLQPNLMIQFDGIASKKLKKIKDEVKELTVFTPTRSMAPGLLPNPGKEAPPPVTAEDSEAEWKPYVIGGTVKTVQEKSLIMDVPDLQPKVKLSLADDLKIKLDLDDLSLVKPGDAIAVQRGIFASEDQPIVNVHTAMIQLANPLTKANKPSKAAAGKSSATSTKPGAGPTKSRSRR